MKRLLEKYLKIYPHESVRFLWIGLIFFTLTFVTAVFRNFVDTAFLKRFGPDYIPWMLVLNAFVTFVAMAIIDRLGKRFSDSVLLAGCLAFYAVSSVSAYFLILNDVKLAYPFLYQLLHLLDTILLVYLWNIAGDLFDTRQGKRIFPLVTAAQMFGATLGSFATKPFTMVAGENASLLFFGVVCLIMGIYLLKTSGEVVGSFAPRTSAQGAPARTIRIWEVPKIAAEYPMIRYLLITGLIPNILLPIFFFQFSVIANDTFKSEQALISFLSVFRGSTTLLTFVLLFFMGRIYSTLGMANSSLVQPINFAILFSALTSSFSIYIACYGQFTSLLIQRAIAGPLNKILYSIIPSDLVVWSRTFIRGTVIKIGMLTGSLLMIVLKKWVSPQYLSLVALVPALYWTIETFVFRKHYRRILKQVITEKQIDFDQIESVRAFDGGAVTELAPGSLDNLEQDIAMGSPTVRVKMDPDAALQLLGDPNASLRADAALSFVESKDIRSVIKLICLLQDPDDEVRKNSIESLTVFGNEILPFLEVSLVEAPPRTKQGILEVIRLSGVKDFDIVPFLGKELEQAYGNLLAHYRLETLREDGADSRSDGVEMLRAHLLERNEEALSLIFYALWVYHADMRLMYQALRSESASLAIELIETSIQKDLGPYLIPLIEDVPVQEKIDKGRKLFPLIRNDTPERLLTRLAHSDDTLTCILALYVIGQRKLGNSFVPIVESRINDSDPEIVEAAAYALETLRGEVAPMPDSIVKINTLGSFGIFEGMGVRELHAIASIMNIEQFEPGDVMIREGEQNSSIYLIVSGRVTVYGNYGLEDQKEKVTLGEGAFLGELSLFTRMAPNATCVAADTTVAYVLRHHQFQEIMKIYPQIGINLCRFFTMKLRMVSY